MFHSSVSHLLPIVCSIRGQLWCYALHLSIGLYTSVSTWHRLPRRHWGQWGGLFNSLRPRQNGRLFADDTFKRIFLNKNIRISTKNSLKFVPKGLINNIPALVLIMAWRRPGDKPLSEPMMVRLLTHICVTRPQWVKKSGLQTSQDKFHLAQNTLGTLYLVSLWYCYFVTVSSFWIWYIMYHGG